MGAIGKALFWLLAVGFALASVVQRVCLLWLVVHVQPAPEYKCSSFLCSFFVLGYSRIDVHFGILGIASVLREYNIPFCLPLFWQ